MYIMFYIKVLDLQFVTRVGSQTVFCLKDKKPTKVSNETFLVKVTLERSLSVCKFMSLM